MAMVKVPLGDAGGGGAAAAEAAAGTTVEIPARRRATSPTSHHQTPVLVRTLCGVGVWPPLPPRAHSWPRLGVACGAGVCSGVVRCKALLCQAQRGSNVSVKGGRRTAPH